MPILSIPRKKTAKTTRMFLFLKSKSRECWLGTPMIEVRWAYWRPQWKIGLNIWETWCGMTIGQGILAHRLHISRSYTVCLNLIKVIRAVNIPCLWTTMIQSAFFWTFTQPLVTVSRLVVLCLRVQSLQLPPKNVNSLLACCKLFCCIYYLSFLQDRGPFQLKLQSFRKH